MLGIAENTFTVYHVRSSFHVIFLMQMVKSGSHSCSGYIIIFCNDVQAVVAAPSHAVAVSEEDEDLSDPSRWSERGDWWQGA